MRLSKLAKAVAPYGIVLETGTKHFKFRGPEGRCYPIPAHNGQRTEVPDVYIRGLCRAYALNLNEILGR